MTPIDKASSNVSVICKRYYVEVILKEIGILGDGSETYEKADRSKEEIIDENQVYSEKLGYTLSEKEKDLPTMYCRPCLETRAITLAHAGTRANYFACVIYRTRKIASNVFFLLLLF